MPSEIFEAAVARTKSITKRPSNEQLLTLYALYKQVTVGDVSGKRPGMFDLKGRAKYDAWAGIKGKSADEAETEYIALVDELAAA